MPAHYFIFFLVLTFFSHHAGAFGYGRIIRKNCHVLKQYQLQMQSPKLHGTNFKFLPSSAYGKNEYAPRILQIAGMFPGVSYEELMLPKSSPAAPPGMWSYEFPDPNGPQLGQVVVPGSAAVADCIDPVALISTTHSLGMSLNVDPVEVLIVVDRHDTIFSSDKFYTIVNRNSEVIISSMDEEDELGIIVGRVSIVMLPFVPSNKVSTGFSEEDEEDE
jgi:Rubisco Assembly chaperone C-terminal domain